MQVDSDGTFHLTYCTNIHPGESLAEVEQNLLNYTVPLKRRLEPDRPFGVGLRLSNEAALELQRDGALDRFKALLDRNGLYVFTLNGFPYGGFHRRTVKDHVYEPDWRSKDRLDYTLRLAGILAALLPDGLDGSISTSPISYKPWLDAAGRASALEAGARSLADAAAELHALREERGRLIHLGIEPEPDCLIENTRETVAFFEDRLFKVGGDYLRKARGMSRAQVEDVLREHVRVCYDTCHFAVEFESPERVLSKLKGAGVRLSKIQISAALRVSLNQEVARSELASALEPFAESTYLHQVVGQTRDGSLKRYRDLPEALPQLEGDDAIQWRIHYHVPIFVDRFERLESTQSDIVPALEHVVREHSCSHLEIETYTWDVLPEQLKSDVVTSIEREYQWVSGRLAFEPAER